MIKEKKMNKDLKTNEKSGENTFGSYHKQLFSLIYKELIFLKRSAPCRKPKGMKNQSIKRERQVAPKCVKVITLT